MVKNFHGDSGMFSARQYFMSTFVRVVSIGWEPEEYSVQDMFVSCFIRLGTRADY